jgi:uncharacterized protein (DUF2342 family)
MGVVVRNNSGVRQLLLYRQAVYLDLPPSPSTSSGQALDGKGENEVDVMAIVEGHVMDVRCSICESLRTWVPGEEALRKLLERARAMRVEV